MSIAGFIPEIWSARLQSSLKKSLVYGAPGVVNRNYEGEIRAAGDSVTITSVSRPAVSNYTRGGSIVREHLTDAQRKLVITEEKYFAFDVDDVDAAQAAGSVMQEGMDEAAYALRDVADQFIAAKYTEAQAANQIGTVSVTTGALAYTQLRRLKVTLDEADVPQEGRWVIVPPWYHGLLLEENKFVDASASGSTEPLLNGRVGRALGFTVYASNNVPLVTGDDWAVMAGYPGAISFAEQINKVEAYRPEDEFSDAVKGLHVYGAKVLRPNGIATVIASET